MMADNPFSFRFYEPANMSSPLIELTHADIGYSETPLLRDANVQVTPDTRIGLLGKNGAGKSTLIKALVGELKICQVLTACQTPLSLATLTSIKWISWMPKPRR